MITKVDIDAFKVYNQTPLEMVRDFASAMGHPLDDKYDQNTKLKKLRRTLIEEEYNELWDADLPVDILKEMADLVYVIFGQAASFGWDLDEALRRVHESNMSKLDNQGNPFKRPDGKVLKGQNYKKPDLTNLV